MNQTQKPCQVLVASVYLVETNIPLPGQQFYFPKPDESWQKCSPVIHQKKSGNCCSLKGLKNKRKKPTSSRYGILLLEAPLSA